ncbi:DNA-binding domain-containing protein, AraC-type [Opitutaceae bacterium TAV1]|nr:DNA-binding domain-containing protein, AraC-type [Opitutaceae bacterium TAV1]
MKLLVSPDLSAQAAMIFHEGGHDVATIRKAGAALAAHASPPDASRILVARAETLPELARMNCDNGSPGVLLLDDRAASSSGLRNLVLPLLRNWRQKQLDGVFTLVSGDTWRRVNYLSYEHGREVASVMVPADCTEHFLHAGSDSHDELKAFGIRLAGISRVTPPYEVRRDHADFHLLALVESGALEISTDAGKRAVQPGDVLFIPAGTRCHYRSRRKTTFLWFHLTPEMYPDTLAIRPAPSPRSRAEAAAHVSRMRKQQILMTYAREYREEAASIYASSLEALLPLATLIGQTLRRHLTDIGVPPGEHDERDNLQRAVSALRDASSPKPLWSVNALAQVAGCSVTRFHRLTKKLLSRTPYELILEARMQRACDLLTHTGFKLDHIAAATGYADAFSFSSAFKRHTGQSPADYRDTHRAAGS